MFVLDAAGSFGAPWRVSTSSKKILCCAAARHVDCWEERKNRIIYPNLSGPNSLRTNQRYKIQKMADAYIDKLSSFMGVAFGLNYFLAFGLEIGEYM